MDVGGLRLKIETMLQYLDDLQQQPESTQHEVQEQVRVRIRVLLEELETFLDEDPECDAIEWTDYLDRLLQASMAVGAIARFAELVKEVVTMLR